MIIPALNEAEALPSVLVELTATLRTRGIAADVLVVDDGSTDDTVVVARHGGAVTLSLPFNLGIGGALRTGFRYAIAEGYRRAVQFDGDGQHDPTEIPALVAALDEGASLVIGSRFADEAHTYEVGRVRRGAMQFLKVAVRIFSGQTFTDTSSGFRAFDRAALELFARDYPVDYMESTEALVMACTSGLRIAEVPVRMRARSHGAPTTRRFRLVYHFTRLLFVMAATATRRRPVQEARP